MSAQDDATTLVAMSVSDLAGHIEGLDLDTLNAALELEQAKGEAARKGAIAALTAAIEGHPEQALAAALAAEADASQAVDLIKPDALQDKPTDPNAVSAAPPRPHDGLVAQLDLRWAELKYFVSQLDGDVEDELGEVLAFVRSKL